jgi:hypothetical protein
MGLIMQLYSQRDPYRLFRGSFWWLQDFLSELMIYGGGPHSWTVTDRLSGRAYIELFQL